MSETINFKIISNKNDEVYMEGFVEILDDLAEDVEWNYWTGNEYQTTPFYHHDAEDIKGLTVEQNRDIDIFSEDYSDDALWIDTCILQSTEEENRTYVRENCTIIINDGAEFEVEYEDYESSEWDADYYMAFTPKFNGSLVTFDNDVYWENPFTYDEHQVRDILYENGAYIIEVPKSIWEYPEETETNEEIMREMCDSFLEVFKKTLVRDFGVYGIAYSISRIVNGDYDVTSESEHQNFANIFEQSFEEMDVVELFFMTEDDIEKLIREEVESNE